MHTKNRKNTYFSGIMALSIALGLCLLVLNSCQSKASSVAPQPIAELLALEIALQRNNTAALPELVKQLTDKALSQDTFVYIDRLFVASKYKPLRKQVINAWLSQYPDNRLARQGAAIMQICDSPDDAAESLSKLLKADTDLIIERYLRCLNDDQRSKLSEQLFAKLSDDPRVQLLYINDLVQSGLKNETLAAIEKIAYQDRITEIKKIQAKLLRETDPERALRVYQQLVIQEPYDIETNFALAELHYDNRKHEQAILHLSRVLDQRPSHRQAQYLTAASHYALGKWQDSEAWFLKLLTASDYRNRAFYYLGEIAVQREKINDAIEFFSKVKRSDYYLSAQLQLWRIIAREQPDLAAMGLAQLAQEFPGDQLVIQLAEIELLAESGKEHSALQKLINLADDYPNNLRLQLLRVRWLVENDHLGRVTQNTLASLSGLQKPEDQFQLLESSVFYLIGQDAGLPAIEILDSQKLVPRNNSRYVFLEGIANAVGGNYDRAIAALEQLLKLAPDNPDYLNALGYTLTLAKQRLGEARTYIEKALELRPDNPAYLDSLAWNYYTMGDTEKAEELLRQAIQLSESASIYAHLIEVLIKNGDIEAAVTELRKAASLFPANRVISMLQNQLAN